MNLLAFDTSTEAMSLAVTSGGRLWEHTGAGGAKASATLIPMLMDLLAQARLALADLDAIVFGRGPGSFTGLRTACSVAQGLAFGAGVKVLPMDTLLAVAEEARHRTGATRVVAALDARMDELYVADYDFASASASAPVAQARLERPETLVVPAGWLLAGNAAAPYGARLAGGALAPGACFDALPTAAAMLRLAPALLAAGQAVPADAALPLYIRDKVALTTEERAAARQAPAA